MQINEKFNCKAPSAVYDREKNRLKVYAGNEAQLYEESTLYMPLYKRNVKEWHHSTKVSHFAQC